MTLARRFSPCAALVLAACSSSSPGGTAAPGGDAGPSTHADAGGGPATPDASPAEASSSADACPTTPPGTARTITGDVTFTADGQGVPFGTQNGSVVHIATADLVGKTLVWATAPGGEQIANIPAPTEAGTTTIGADLTAHFTTGAKYTNGPWELAVFVSVTGGDFTKGPQPGDIAAFDLTPPPACEPPVTGVSIRVTIADADATVSITNAEFIEF